MSRRSISKAAHIAGRLAIALGALAGLPAEGGVGASSFTAQVLVNSNCTIATTPVVFGSYDPIGAQRTANLNAVGTVVVACVRGTAPSIALGTGAHASGSTRRMSDAGNSDFLVYELYRPAANTPNAPCSFPGTTVWGSAGANLFVATAAPDRNARSYNVCGTVFSAQNPRVGTYADTVVATVNF